MMGIREYLLAALKIVNGPNQRDDIIKACVLLLLAQIYQETDFGLAEKMSSTAYELYRNLGNDRLALAAGNILARLFDIQGAVEKAKQQIAANDKHEEAMGSG